MWLQLLRVLNGLGFDNGTWCYHGYHVLLCTGGYGFVFIAQDVRSNKLFALKVSKACITLVLLIHC